MKFRNLILAGMATAMIILGGALAAQPVVAPPLRPLTMGSVTGPRSFTSASEGRFNGRSIRYRTTVSETIIHNPGGEPVASLFTTAYVAQEIGDPALRPVLFAFNGGPGASSALVHLGAMGPRILKGHSLEDLANPAIQLEDNPLSLLDVADLVFIDPVDTGFSRRFANVPASEFHSVDADSDSVTQVITHWIVKNGRQSSPIYVFGESYGSMRAVAVARDLARASPATRVSGIILGGFAITYGQRGNVANHGWSAARLPMMASVAWFHRKIDRDQTWEQAVERARVFARDIYLPALYMGHQLDPAARDRVIAQLPAIIGIPADYFRTNNSIAIPDFNSLLLRDSKRVLDRNDGRQTRPAGAPLPTIHEQYAGLESAMNRYATNQLKVSKLGKYAVLTPNLGETVSDWNFMTTGAPSLDVTLANLMRENGKLRLFIAQGRYDTLTTLGNTEYALAQVELPRDRISWAFYDGGHSLEPDPQLIARLRAFLSLPAGRTPDAG